VAWIGTGLTAVPPILLFLWLARIHETRRRREAALRPAEA
jgi:hypothetical protein